MCLMYCMKVISVSSAVHYLLERARTEEPGEVVTVVVLLSVLIVLSWGLCEKKEESHIHNNFFTATCGTYTHKSVQTRLTIPDKVFVGLVTAQNSFAEVRVISVGKWETQIHIVSCLVCQTHINPIDKKHLKDLQPYYRGEVLNKLYLVCCPLMNVLKTHSTCLSSFTFALIQLLSFSRDAFFLLSSTALVVLEVVPVFNNKY